MNVKLSVALPDYEELKKFLEIERKTLVKNSAFSEEDDFIRTVEEASVVLDSVSKIQEVLWKCFKNNPSLIGLFNDEFASFVDFITRDTILELCFLDDYIFADKELFPFEGENGVLKSDLIGYENYFRDWTTNAESAHKKGQELIKHDFSMELRSKDIECKCVGCIADFKAKLRETVFNSCIVLVNDAQELVDQNLHQGLISVGKHFYQLQKKLDRNFHEVRYRLKRPTLKRLESQVKSVVRDKFHYPSDLAIKHSETIKSFFISLLKKQGLRKDLIDEEQYQRFFTQLRNKLWRDEKYLEVEFKKLVNSVLLLKRKDISAKILKDYLGEFWVHAGVRQIKRKIIYHLGPTNSGKTFSAINSLCQADKGCYLAPLRLLAAELYDTMNGKGVKTTLLTGEEVIETEDATHYSSTVEMARFNEVFDCCVIDEIQMMSDPQRGWAWTRALVNIFSPVVHICGDDSVLDLVTNIVNLCGDTLEIEKYERLTDLEVSKGPTVLGDLQKADALIVFSRKKALQYKYDLEQMGFKVSIVYGRLSPEVRREQARKFDEGITDIMVSTDAIAMGMNLPIKRIVFTTLSKFINSEEYKITASEIKQISGRAGRYLRFPTGTITCLARVENGTSNIERAIKSATIQKDKCMVGPDLDIFLQVNNALEANSLPLLSLSEFLRLFNTMTFKKPFYCVDLKEMIELAEMVEDTDPKNILKSSEIFGFACAPVHLGLLDHIEHFMWIVSRFVNSQPIHYEAIDDGQDDIDYLETSIKCVELFQWLARHFNGKNFDFDDVELFHNKSSAISKLNDLLSDKIMPTCSSCGKKLEENSRFAICESCFRNRRYGRNDRRRTEKKDFKPTNKSKEIKKSKNFRKKRRS